MSLITSTTMYVEAYTTESTNTFYDFQTSSGTVQVFNPTPTVVWLSLGTDGYTPPALAIPAVDGNIGSGFPVLPGTATIMSVPYRNGNLFVNTLTASGTAGIYISPVIEIAPQGK